MRPQTEASKAPTHPTFSEGAQAITSSACSRENALLSIPSPWDKAGERKKMEEKRETPDLNHRPAPTSSWACRHLGHTAGGWGFYLLAHPARLCSKPRWLIPAFILKTTL